MSLSALSVAGGAACGAAFRAVPELPAGTAGLTCAADQPADSLARVTWVRGPAVDRQQLDRWCAGVGPAVVRHHEAPGGDSAVVARDLVVVSWNTNVGGGDLHRFIGDLRAGRLTGGDRVEHFVLLLQEVYRAGADVPRADAARPRRIASRPPQGQRVEVGEVARHHGLHLFYVPSMANGVVPAEGLAEDRGNAIVSTLPLEQHLAIELPFEGQRRVAASAVVRSTTVDGRRLQLRLVSVHLDNRSTLSRIRHSFGRGRARQATALTEALARETAPHEATVVAGDLNTWAPNTWEHALTVLRAHFPHGNATNGPTYAGRPMGVGRTLDHMMFRLPESGAGLAVHSGPSPAPTDGASVLASFVAPQSVRLDDAHGSDHYPLIARLHLTDGH